jgi:hypothetical protein
MPGCCDNCGSARTCNLVYYGYRLFSRSHCRSLLDVCSGRKEC